MALRILVTGGAGFQGSHLVSRWLDAGHEITVLNTRSEMAVANIALFADRISVVWGSITDRDIVKGAIRDQDVVVHMAARINVDESLSSPRAVLEVNVMGTHNVLESVREGGQRLIFASSCEVYGGGHTRKVKETADLRPYSVYAVSKASADRLCFSYWKSYGVDVCIIRASNVFGPRQKGGEGGAVIPRFVDKGLRGDPLEVYGSGTQRREFMFIDDLVSAFDLVLEKQDMGGEVINFGSRETQSIKEIALQIGERFGVPVNFGPGRPGEVDRFELDSSKAGKLGFTPRVPFWEGLDRYLDWRCSQAESHDGQA